jgi:hypothetical protein
MSAKVFESRPALAVAGRTLPATSSVSGMGSVAQVLHRLAAGVAVGRDVLDHVAGTSQAAEPKFWPSADAMTLRASSRFDGTRLLGSQGSATDAQTATAQKLAEQFQIRYSLIDESLAAFLVP